AVSELSLNPVIRIRPGRSWRINPAYVGELRALRGARAKGFTGSDILDVLGIEVDGVDIAAGVGEARVLQAVDELAQALIRIGEGQPAAQATIGPGPTELVLEARGHDLLLTLVTLAPPARILASGLLVDAHKMRTATLHAARGLLLDLLAISPALSRARLARRLVEAWEGGEPAFTLPLGTHELRWDLTCDEVRAQGWRKPLKLPPLRFAKVAAGAAELYADETLRAGTDELAADLRDRAQALLRHSADLESGDLRRAPAAVIAPPAREGQEKKPPLARGRIRRLVYRE